MEVPEERKLLRERFVRDTLAAWEDYQATSLHLTGEEVDAWLARLEAGEHCEPPATPEPAPGRSKVQRS